MQDDWVAFVSRKRLFYFSAISLAMAFLLYENYPAAVSTALVTFVILLRLRDPQRQTPSDPLGIVAPVDGKVTGIEENPSESHGRMRIHIRIATWPAVALRSPTEGYVRERQKPHNSAVRRAKGMKIETDEHDEVVFIVTGTPILPPKAFPAIGQRVGQGQRCGLIGLAHHASVDLPNGSSLSIAVGDQVVGGETILGHFPRPAGV